MSPSWRWRGITGQEGFFMSLNVYECSGSILPYDILWCTYNKNTYIYMCAKMLIILLRFTPCCILNRFFCFIAILQQSICSYSCFNGLFMKLKLTQEFLCPNRWCWANGEKLTFKLMELQTAFWSVCGCYVCVFLCVGGKKNENSVHAIVLFLKDDLVDFQNLLVITLLTYSVNMSSFIMFSAAENQKLLTWHVHHQRVI